MILRHDVQAAVGVHRRDSKVSIGNSSNPYAFAYTGTYVDRRLENFRSASATTNGTDT